MAAQHTRELKNREKLLLKTEAEVTELGTQKKQLMSLIETMNKQFSEEREEFLRKIREFDLLMFQLKKEIYELQRTNLSQQEQINTQAHDLRVLQRHLKTDRRRPDNDLGYDRRISNEDSGN